MIRTDKLGKSYGRVNALRGLDLQVEAGEIYGLLGPDGAGRTTALRRLLDLVRPGAGSIAIFGLDRATQPVAMVVPDEPGSGLDPVVRREFHDHPREFTGAVLFSSPVLSEVEHVAGRVGILPGGELPGVREASVGMLIGQASAAVTAALAAPFGAVTLAGGSAFGRRGLAAAAGIGV
jgi:ABC-type multidrug transport system ATPase subunit